MSGYADQQRDQDRLRQRQDETDRARARDAQADIVIEMPRRLFLRSEDGTYFAVSISNAGAVTTTNMGSKLP